MVLLVFFFFFLPFSSFFSFAFQDSSLGILAKIPFNSSFLNILFPSTTNMHMCTWARKTKKASSLMWLKLWFSYTLAPPYGSTLVSALNCSTYIVQYICFHIFWKHQNICFLDFFMLLNTTLAEVYSVSHLKMACHIIKFSTSLTTVTW